MAFWSEIRPRTLRRALAAIDAEAAAERAEAATPDRRPPVALLTAAVSLLLIHYLKFATTFHAFVDQLSGWLGRPGSLYATLTRGRYFLLLNETWWAWWHVVGYVLLPVLVIKTVFRGRVRDYGTRLVGLSTHYPWYLLLVAPILCFVVLASFRPDFGSHYPFYRLASRSWLDLLAWESLYLLQFVCLEFFFRGFLLSSLKTAFGSNAIFVMCLPYLMIHFAKPWLEATGAILFGMLLGVLALRSRSIWGGVLVHAGVAVSMDIAALLQTQGLPGRWLP